MVGRRLRRNYQKKENLTISQYLRLFCVKTLPVERCCHSGKESHYTKKPHVLAGRQDTEHTDDQPEAQTINEGGEQIDSGK